LLPGLEPAGFNRRDARKFDGIERDACTPLSFPADRHDSQLVFEVESLKDYFLPHQVDASSQADACSYSPYASVKAISMQASTDLHCCISSRRSSISSQPRTQGNLMDSANMLEAICLSCEQLVAIFLAMPSFAGLIVCMP
jgi:hypothetical protein